jgi:hypothetical protein
MLVGPTLVMRKSTPMGRRDRPGAADSRTERERLLARATQLEKEIVSGRAELRAKRAAVEQGQRASAKPARPGLGDFVFVLAGVLALLVVLVALSVRGCVT